jgi:hypothetical protein
MAVPRKAKILWCAPLPVRTRTEEAIPAFADALTPDPKDPPAHESI